MLKYFTRSILLTLRTTFCCFNYTTRKPLKVTAGKLVDRERKKWKFDGTRSGEYGVCGITSHSSSWIIALVIWYFVTLPPRSSLSNWGFKRMESLAMTLSSDGYFLRNQLHSRRRLFCPTRCTISVYLVCFVSWLSFLSLTLMLFGKIIQIPAVKI